ncbi:hypothetical protein EV361DRAFT_952807 [Lentinula raphanica]|nr:hypothetical protein EV361DRAFT_952807 [Lentinula raphanica]
MPISIGSVGTITVALLLLASAVDIVAAPVSATIPNQMPSTQHIGRRAGNLDVKVYARRSDHGGNTGIITNTDKYRLRPGETVNICLDDVDLDVQRKKPNAPKAPNSKHNLPKSEEWHVKPAKNYMTMKDPWMLYLGVIHFPNPEVKRSLLGLDVSNRAERITGSLFTEVIESENSISPGPLESHETANLVIEELRRWSNDPQVRMKFEEEEVEHPETKEKIKVWDAFFLASKTLQSIAGWDTSTLLESVSYPDVDKLELDWDKIGKEVEARLEAQYGPRVKDEHE